MKVSRFRLAGLAVTLRYALILNLEQYAKASLAHAALLHVVSQALRGASNTPLRRLSGDPHRHGLLSGPREIDNVLARSHQFL